MTMMSAWVAWGYLSTGVEWGEYALLEDLTAQSEGCRIAHFLANPIGSYREMDSALRELLQVVHLGQVCVRLDLDRNSNFDWLEADDRLEMACLKNVLDHSEPLFDEL